MVFLQNCGVFSSLFILLFKIISEFVEYYCPMYNKRSITLSSIPEKVECDDVRKWVPKNKHEVLKAKYKCLKKLFQIYDASVIGILPEQCDQDATSVADDNRRTRRKKRSTRTKNDACAGTSEYSSGDGTEESSEKASTVATAVMRELQLNPCSCTSTQFDTPPPSKYASTQASRDDVTCACDCAQSAAPPLPYRVSRPRTTRFQSFIQRIFGIRRDYRTPDGHIYAASDNNIAHERRRRRGLRFRKLRRPKKTQSDLELRNVQSPMILNYVQSVQRSCLTDTTPRQCPITGCRMISYGIINYNDHLNLCHFPERKYVCHYCHEGFHSENERNLHENEHLGITKLNLTSTDSSREYANKTSVTQTEPEFNRCAVHEEKLKKIVSFFDKISDPDQVFSNAKKNRFSESNLQNKMEMRANNVASTDVDSNSNSTDCERDKRVVSCMNLRRKFDKRMYSSTLGSDVSSRGHSPVGCSYCGEMFDCRRQLSLHMDLEHRSHGKYSKFHSCAGITCAKSHVCCDDRLRANRAESRADQSVSRRQLSLHMDLERRSHGKYSKFHSCAGITCAKSQVCCDDRLRANRAESRADQSVSRDPSTNVVYTSENVTKPSLSSFIGRGGYQWEPGTKIVRV